MSVTLRLYFLRALLVLMEPEERTDFPASVDTDDIDFVEELCELTLSDLVNALGTHQCTASKTLAIYAHIVRLSIMIGWFRFDE